MKVVRDTGPANQARKVKVAEFYAAVRGDVLRFHELGMSLRGIANNLNHIGLRTRSGRKWTHTAVRRALAYYGVSGVEAAGGADNGPLADFFSR